MSDVTAQRREQRFAANLLQARADGGIRFGRYLRLSARRYLVIALTLAFALPLFAREGEWALFNLTLGLFLGVLAADCGWVRASQRAWPCTEATTDWDKVARLAAETTERA